MALSETDPLRELQRLRWELAGGAGATQRQLDEIGGRWEECREALRPGEKDERLDLVDAAGNTVDLTAPRWLCHVLGLRHRSTHVLLWWSSPALGRVFVLQVRSWGKELMAGQLDISVGGHVVAGAGAEATAYAEMDEELGLGRQHVRGGELAYYRGHESRTEADDYCDLEWCEVYGGEINTEGLERIHFKDGEVVGLYLCPEAEIGGLLEQKIIPVASGLAYSLPYFMAKCAKY